MDINYPEKITLDRLASSFYINKYYLTRVFKEQFGTSINSYLQMVRITHAKQMLRFTDRTVEDVGHACGLGALNYFSRTFKDIEGVAPSVYREQWQGQSGCKEVEDEKVNILQIEANIMD